MLEKAKHLNSGNKTVFLKVTLGEIFSETVLRLARS